MGLYGPVSTSATILPRGNTGAALRPLSARRLTRREHEVLRLVCLRLTDPEIASHLFIGTRFAGPEWMGADVPAEPAPAAGDDS